MPKSTRTTPSITERFGEFFSTQSASGAALIVATVTAMVAANSGLADIYHGLLNLPLGLGVGRFTISRPLHFWINDGLMALFFFTIGLEIKREALVGELASLQRSVLPIAGALGGMILPAIIYATINSSGIPSRGWGIPMATDIAFALGVLALLGDRVPTGLKVFLAALAIADDLGAVIVIAIFYTDTISLIPLAIGLLLVGVAMLLNMLDVRGPGWFAIIGLGVWICFLLSGVHPTIAGVLMGFTIPVRAIYDGEKWRRSVERSLNEYNVAIEEESEGMNELDDIARRQDAVQKIEDASEKALSPLMRLEHGLQPWVAFAIMPLFALANAGIPLSTASLSASIGSGISWGVFLGLLIGKQLGVFLFSWLAVRMKMAALPDGVQWQQFYGVAILAGIGFTMSLFVTELAFRGSPELLDQAKVGIMAASLLSGILGHLWLRTKGEG